MSKWAISAWLVWVVVSVLAFAKDPILGAFALIFFGGLAVVLTMASNWDDHPDYEARELARSQRRAVKHEKTRGKREKDAARYAAGKVRQEERAARKAS